MMSGNQQIRIPATYMRGGTSKGVFFKLEDLPEPARRPGKARDSLLLRVIGSPDPYGKQTDGMGGATSSTSKTVILSKSTKDDHDVDYLFGQVSIDKEFVDWSGNCGNLTAAVGAFAVSNNLVDDNKVPENGIAKIKIWQCNINKSIIAHVPITNGGVQELGDFVLDGVTFPAAETKIEFLNPVGEGSIFPTGKTIEKLVVPEIGTFEATMINAGIPTIFLKAKELGYTGIELQEDINGDQLALEKFETIRAHGALAMGLIESVDEAENRQHTPKIAFVGTQQSYISSSGKSIHANDIDLVIRALSMGFLHHAMMGTAAVAIATAAVIPNTLVSQAVSSKKTDISSVTFGHPSGTLKVGAKAEIVKGEWQVERVTMSRSARRLMQGDIFIPSDCFTVI